MKPYAKFMCSCGLSIGTFYYKQLKCKCGKIFKYKIMKDGNDDKEWNSITLEYCTIRKTK